MKIYGLDPSFRKFGFAVIDTATKTVSLAYVEGGFSRIFPETASEAYRTVKRVIGQIDPGSVVAVEQPIMHARACGGELSVLQGILYAELLAIGARITYYDPRNLDVFCGKKHGSRKKADDIAVAERLIDGLQDGGWTIVGRWVKPTEKGSDDRADAFLYAYAELTKQ